MAGGKHIVLHTLRQTHELRCLLCKVSCIHVIVNLNLCSLVLSSQNICENEVSCVLWLLKVTAPFCHLKETNSQMNIKTQLKSKHKIKQ